MAELTRALIVKATREKRFRPRAVRIDSTVIEADIKYPTDAGLASLGVRALAREGRKLATLVGETAGAGAGSLACDGPEAAGDRAHDPPALGRGEGEVLELTKQTGELLERSITEARRLAAIAQAHGRAGAAHAPSSRAARGWRS